jgi:hypothetical protein
MAAQPPPSIKLATTPSRFPGATQIQARVIFGEVTYFALTREQINTHTTLGWLTTVCISLAGLAFEAAIGASLAIAQGTGTPASMATLTNVLWATALAGSLLAITAVVFVLLKASTRRGWLTNTVRLSPANGESEAA